MPPWRFLLPSRLRVLPGAPAPTPAGLQSGYNSPAAPSGLAERGTSDGTTTNKELEMGIGIGVFFMALGAILVWAVTGEVQGVDLDVAGVILLVLGAVAVLWGLLAASSLSRRADGAVNETRSRDRV